MAVGKIKSLEFQDVNFDYPKLKEKENEGSKSVLKNVSINFEKNKITALVGESGSGKSTIVQLMMRFYDPSNGKISINGTSLT